MARRARRRTKPKPHLSPEALRLVAQRFRVLGEAARLQILQALFAGELSVQEVCEQTGLKQANVSKHLSLLAREGLLSRRKEGLFVRYAISDESVYALCELVCGALAEKFERATAAFS